MSDKAKALDLLISETVSFYQRLKAVAEELHGLKRLSGGKRGVLMDLYQNGMQTVPQMARSRPVSRQHIQTIVNPLAEKGLVEFIENPAHRRSRLVGLTEKGVSLVEEMRRREKELFSQFEIDVSEQSILDSVSVLRSIRETFTSMHTGKLLNNIRKKEGKNE